MRSIESTNQRLGITKGFFAQPYSFSGVYVIGILIILLGVLNQQFLSVRPNRIEKGFSVSIQDAMGLKAGLLLCIFILLMSVLVVHWKRSTLQKYIQVGLSLLLWLCYIAMTGQACTDAMIGQQTSGRVALGIGFWSINMGIGLILWYSMDRIELIFLKPMVFVVCMSSVSLFYRLGIIQDISIIREFTDKSERILSEVMAHMKLSLLSVVCGFIISLTLSYIAYRKPRMEQLLIGVANFAQVIPTLSLLGLLMIPLAFLASTYPFLKNLGISGIGFFPAFVVLTLYALLPLVTSCLAGFRTIPKYIIEAAESMGMTNRQKFFLVELPMALPAILTGLKIAVVQTIGNCILAGLVGGGGIGSILFLGLAQSAPDLVVLASLLVVTIAVFFDVVLSSIVRVVRIRFRGDIAHD